MDLHALDAALRRLSKDDGLTIHESRRAFTEWKRLHERRVVAVRAKAVGAEQAKADLGEMGPPQTLVLRLDVPLAEVLVGVAGLIGAHDAGLADRLAENPIHTLTQLGGFASPEDLDAAALRLYDADEQRRALSTRGTKWKEQIRRLAVLIRMSASETRSGVRAHDKLVGEMLSLDLQKPSDLVGPVDELFASHETLRQQISNGLDDGAFGLDPDDGEILRWARDAGIDDATIAKYENALSEPRNKRAAQLRARSGRLSAAHLTATVPAGLVPPKSAVIQLQEPTDQWAPSEDPIKVPKIKVSTTFDQRKRELGDEGEQWALADAVGTFLALNDADRVNAVDGVRRLLGYFEPAATKPLLEHANAAAAPRQQGDEDDLVAALEGLLHVSRHSDGFGFDLVGWAPPQPDAPPHAMCLEVKSTSGGGFNLSNNEWSVASKLRTRGAADYYAILAVHRGMADQVPVSMDLLVDPVCLEQAGLLLLATDGYIAKYSVR
jgi:hypothetical protein